MASKNSPRVNAYAVSGNALEKLWRTFNVVADGFGLTEEEFLDILTAGITTDYGREDETLGPAGAELFALFDTDKVPSLIILTRFAVLTKKDDVRRTGWSMPSR